MGTFLRALSLCAVAWSSGTPLIENSRRDWYVGGTRGKVLMVALP
jgi:hypothetical protein